MYPHLDHRSTRKFNQYKGKSVSGQMKLTNMALHKPDQLCTGG